MKTTSITRKKPNKSSEIKTIPESAPWIMVVRAVEQSGVGEHEIRQKFKLRRFGNADYVSPSSLNHWIMTGEVK